MPYFRFRNDKISREFIHWRMFRKRDQETKEDAKEEIKKMEYKKDYQEVIITLDDGTKLSYTGEANLYPGDTRSVRNIQFTEPRPLPEGCSFGPIQEGGKT